RSRTSWGRVGRRARVTPAASARAMRASRSSPSSSARFICPSWGRRGAYASQSASQSAHERAALPLGPGEHDARAGDVARDLGLELVERAELLLLAERGDEMDADARVVEVARVVEEERLDREPPPADGRTDA